MEQKLKIGMGYEEAKNIFQNFINNEANMGNMSWFTALPKNKIFGIYPVIQITSKNGVVVEISLLPDWRMYGKEGEKEEAESIYISNVEYLTNRYGKPNKEKENSKTWILPGNIKIKTEFEKRVGYTVHIVMKQN